MNQVQAIEDLLRSLERGANALERIAAKVDAHPAELDVASLAETLFVHLSHSACPACGRFIGAGFQHGPGCKHGEVEKLVKEALGG